MADDSASLDDLLADLASDDDRAAEEAQFSLQTFGARAVEPVLQRLPHLGVFGQRCALDLLQSWPSEMVQLARMPSIAEAVVPLLLAKDDVVRGWAADTLLHANARVAIPALRQALDRAKRAGVPLDEYEPVALRRALTALGDRRESIPSLLARLAQRGQGLGSYWPADRLREVVDALATEGQVLLYFEGWQRREATFSWIKTPRFDVDLRGSWTEVVERASLAVKRAIDGWDPPPNTVVTLEWIGEDDR